MTNRKATPDILGSLLSGGDQTPDQQKPEGNNTIIPEGHNTGIPECNNTIIPAYHNTIKKPKRETGRTSPGSGKKYIASEEKDKATFYLSAKVIEGLENGWLNLRKLAPRSVRGKASKSLIVELALEIALEDLKAKGRNSSLITRLLEE